MSEVEAFEAQAPDGARSSGLGANTDLVVVVPHMGVGGAQRVVSNDASTG